MEILFAITLLVVCVSWMAAVRVRTIRRLRAAEHSSDGDVCLLCRSTDLQLLPKGAHRCGRCGSVQGPAAHLYRDQARRAGYARLTATERAGLAAGLLAEASLELLAVEGELEHVLELSDADRQPGAGGDGGREKLSRFANVLHKIAILEQRLVDAALSLAAPAQLERLSVDIGTAAAILDEMDVRIWWDIGGSSGSISGFGEGRTHTEIERAIEHVKGMRGLLDQLNARKEAVA